MQLLINGSEVDNTTIALLESGISANISLYWTPNMTGEFEVEVFAVPSPGENITWDNNLSTSVSVITAPDIWVNPLEINITVEKGDAVNRILTVGNVGTDDLNATL